MNPSTQNKKIEFLIIGAQKSGTSALDHYLRQHHEIEMAKKKELHFFDNELIFSEKSISYSKLEEQFNIPLQSKILGETTPIYIYWESSCKRIWEYNPSMKLIAIIRNPIERAFSHWNMEFNRNAETENFNYCIKNEKYRTKEALPFQHRVYSYVDRGFYSEQIRRFRRYFNEEQLLFIKYDDFKKNQENELNKIFNFLGVNPDRFSFTPKIIRKSQYTQEMKKEEKEYLISIFENDIREVEKLLNWRCCEWLK